MKKNRLKRFNLAILVSLIVIGGWFFWFQYRPAQIRKECLQTSGLATDQTDQDKTISFNSLNRYFSFCLASKGLKPEQLFQK